MKTTPRICRTCKYFSRERKKKVNGYCIKQRCNTQSHSTCILYKNA